MRPQTFLIAVAGPKSRLSTSDNMIGKPYALADLPASLIGSGEILAADVHALSGSSKKKRSELAVAIDNESVNIYDVTHQHVFETADGD